VGSSLDSNRFLTGNFGLFLDEGFEAKN
jgi:hypothetical protein